MVAEFRDVVVVTSDHDFLPASAKLPVAVPVPPSASCDPPLPELPTVLVYCVVLHLGVGRRRVLDLHPSQAVGIQETRTAPSSSSPLCAFNRKLSWLMM